jgi:hypothetical protein
VGPAGDLVARTSIASAWPRPIVLPVEPEDFRQQGHAVLTAAEALVVPGIDHG